MSISGNAYTVPLMAGSPIVPGDYQRIVGTASIVQTSSEDSVSLHIDGKITDPAMQKLIKLHSLGACVDTDSGKVLWASLYPKKDAND